MNERRRDYVDLGEKISLVDSEVKVVKKLFEDYKSRDKEWIESLKRHNAKLIHLQGYEDRFNLKLGTLQDSINEVKEIVLRQNSRLSRLENWRWFVVGGLAIIGFVISIGLPISLGVLNDVQRDIRLNDTAVNEHVSHPEYHQTIAKEISWIKNKLNEWSRSR